MEVPTWHGHTVHFVSTLLQISHLPTPRYKGHIEYLGMWLCLLLCKGLLKVFALMHMRGQRT